MIPPFEVSFANFITCVLNIIAQIHPAQNKGANADCANPIKYQQQQSPHPLIPHEIYPSIPVPNPGNMRFPIKTMSATAGLRTGIGLPQIVVGASIEIATPGPPTDTP